MYTVYARMFLIWMESYTLARVMLWSLFWWTPKWQRVRPWFATAYLYNEALYRDQSTRHNLVCSTHCDQRAFSNTFSTCPEWSYAVWFECQWSLFLRAHLAINKQWYISWYVFERAAPDKPLHNVWSPRLIPRFLFSISNATFRQ